MSRMKLYWPRLVSPVYGRWVTGTVNIPGWWHRSWAAFRGDGFEIPRGRVGSHGQNGIKSWVADGGLSTVLDTPDHGLAKEVNVE